jgi:2-oxoglutarate dehydrogenase E2 component (dihydrolipoamide succinyltransferase)
MPVEVRVPALGESVLEATVGGWLKSQGDAVAPGDPLVELETEKVAVEVTAEAAGVLDRIEHREGDTVHVGDVLAVLSDGGAPAKPSDVVTAPPSPGTEDQARAAEDAASTGPQPGKAPDKSSEAPAVTVQQPPPVPLEPTGSSPSARRRAAEAGAEQTAAGGAGDRSPVPGPVARPPASSAPPLSAPKASPQARSSAAPPASHVSGREERVRLSRRRLTIARRLLEAQQTAAILTTFNEVDMTAVMAVRQRRRDPFKEKYGIGLGYMSFFTRATVGALKAFPSLNAEMRDDELILKHYYDIGIAVGAEEGLVVPVLRDADRKSFAEIEREIADLGKRARENSLSLEDLMGGTFTITNGGVFGSLLSTPILNPPQVGILGMHKIQERPMAIKGQVEVRPMMYLALSYDHRVVDGREAVQFLVRLKELLEDPETLLLEG